MSTNLVPLPGVVYQEAEVEPDSFEHDMQQAHLQLGGLSRVFGIFKWVDKQGRACVTNWSVQMRPMPDFCGGGIMHSPRWQTCSNRESVYSNQSFLPSLCGTSQLSRKFKDYEFDDLPGFLQQARRLLAPAGRMLVVEPGGHVKPAQFEAMLAVCAEQGFVELERPSLAGKRLAVVLGCAPR